MSKYSNQEMADMHLLHGLIKYNSIENWNIFIYIWIIFLIDLIYLSDKETFQGLYECWFYTECMILYRFI